MSEESFGDRFRNWKNQYIDLVESKTDRIVSLTSPLPRPEQREQVHAWLRGYERVICEIGSGSGGHLIERAAQDPKAAYIGFELRFKRAFRTVEKAERRGVANLFLIRADAVSLPNFFDAGSLAGVYVNFPDPWAKAKWKKNRILNPGFLAEIGELLGHGGFLSYKTDHREYFEETLATLQKMPIFTLAKVTRDLHHSEFLEGNIPTEFENLFLSQGLPIHSLHAIKLGSKLCSDL